MTTNSNRLRLHPRGIAATVLVTWILLLVGFGGGAALPPEVASSKAGQLVEAARPLVIGHRGYPAVAPENTLESFRLALAAGADLVELDYHHTQDGVPVVIHDAELDRTTDAKRVLKGSKIRVDSRPMADLARLDAGSWYRARYSGLPLPRLTEALELIQSNGVTLIERKGGDAATCVKLLRDRDLINQVVVQAFDWEYLRAFHALEPRQLLGALGPPSGRKLTEAEKVLTVSWVEQAHQVGAHIVVWNRRIDRAAISAARERGMKVWVYTINAADVANELLDLGVNGLITDNPAAMWRTLTLRK